MEIPEPPKLSFSLDAWMDGDAQDDVESYDQWQLWARQSQRQKPQDSDSHDEVRNLIRDHVDPRVEQHMKWMPKEKDGNNDSSHNSNMDSVQEKVKCRRQLRQLSRDEQDRAGTVEFCRDNHARMDFLKVCANPSYKRQMIPNPTRLAASRDQAAIPGDAHSHPNDLLLATNHTTLLQQEAILHDIEKNKHQPPSLLAWEDSDPVYVERDGQPHVNIHSKNLVNHALQRGASVRVIDCSGCSRSLLITPEIPLVFCPRCECYSTCP